MRNSLVLKMPSKELLDLPKLVKERNLPKSTLRKISKNKKKSKNLPNLQFKRRKAKKEPRRSPKLR